VVPLWIAVPHYRVYSWHNMMQMGACYQITRLPAIPEEPDMAGERLHYPWLGHVQITAISKLVDRPPTLLFPLSNLAMLWATFAALYGTALRILPAEKRDRRLAAVGVTLALLGTNFLGMAGGLLTNSPWLIGDSRYSPLTGKFSNLDSMAAGLALLAGIVEVSVAALGAVRPRACLLLPVLALAVGITYPLLLPAAGVLAGLLAVALWQRRLAAVPAYAIRTRVALVVGLGIAGALAHAYLRFLTEGGSSELLSFGVKRVLFNLTKLPLLIGPWVLLAHPVVVRAWKGRDAPTLFLAAGSLATGALFVGTRFPYTAEYKFAFAMCYCLIPLVAVRILEWLARAGRTAMAWAAAALVLTWLVALGFSLRFNVPWHTLAHAVALDESAFGIRLLSGPESEWIDAVREQTPADSLLLVEPSYSPISILARRSSYIGADAPDMARPGYSMTLEDVLLNNGYPRDEIARRQEALDAAFEPGEGADFEWLTAELRRLHRPVSIVFGSGGSAYLSWLRARGPGREIFRGGDRVVWLLGDPAGQDAPAPLGG
jgi:hypothetical protein